MANNSKISTIEKYNTITVSELLKRGYALNISNDMVEKSELHSLLQGEEAWAYCHDMGPKEWADWIEIEFGYKPQPTPLWKQRIAI